MLLRQCPFLLKVLLIQQVVCGFSLSEVFTPLIKVEGMQNFQTRWWQHSGNHQPGLASCKYYGPITANNQDVSKSLTHKTLRTHIEVFLKWFSCTYRISNFLNVFTLPDVRKILFLFQEIRKLAEGSETFSPTTMHLYQQLGKQVQSRLDVQLYMSVKILNVISVGTVLVTNERYTYNSNLLLIIHCFYLFLDASCRLD